MTILLAAVAGGLLGYVLERGDLCFHSTWRGLLAKPQETELARAYLLLLLLAIPLVQLMIALDLIDPFIPPLNVAANGLGGLVFGIGMVVAATCVTGMFYKFGHGMLGTVVALVGWAIGDVATYRGPLSVIRDDLTGEPTMIDDRPATINAVAGTGTAAAIVAWVAVVAFLVVVGRYLHRDRTLPGAHIRGRLWGWLRLGGALTAVTALAWVLVTADGGDYSFGTSGVPSSVWDWIRGTSSVADSGGLWIPVALVAIAPGSYVAARRAGTLWVRGETPARYLQLGVGGLIMGVGGAIAGGCNLGHSMVGVPLLSVASMVTTVAMILGIFLADRVVRVAATARHGSPAGAPVRAVGNRAERE